MAQIAVVTGGNRGLGFEACRQLGKKGFTVILTARDGEKGAAALRKLKREKITAHFFACDVTNGSDIRKLAKYIKKEFGRLELLVNNAGIFPGEQGWDYQKFTRREMLAAFETNTLAPLFLAQALIPLMQGQGKIINVSSGLGSLYEMGGAYLAYRVSKTALNAVTRVLQAELSTTGIAVNSICPGWVKTDMGGKNAPRTPAQGVETIVWLATLEKGVPRGKFLRDKMEIPW